MKDNKVFLDTNILIYAYDVSAGEKHRTAGGIVMDLWKSGLGLTSTQVLQEFFVNVTRKIPKPLDKRLAGDIVSDFLKWDVIVNDGGSILGAIEILLKYNYSFWDALIIEAAVRGGSSLLLSEDLAHGQIIEGIPIENPFLSHLA
jgi:predicted nucleic acid-binding protein